MNPWFKSNQSAIKFNQSFIPKLNTVISPFLSSLGITYFGYTRFLPGKRYISLCSSVSWYQHIDGQRCKESGYFRKPISKVPAEWSVLWDLEPENMYVKAFAAQGIGHGFSTYRSRNNFIEGWHFAGELGNKNLNFLYLNEQDKINCFISYFKEKSRDFIDLSKPEHMMHYLRDFDLRLPERAENRPPNSDLFTLRKYHLNEGTTDTPLTLQELRCVQKLSGGLTMKEVASELALSNRTVEHYLDSARRKTRSFDRSELVRLYQKSDLARWFGKSSI